jgi:hypothetical protein
MFRFNSTIEISDDEAEDVAPEKRVLHPLIVPASRTKQLTLTEMCLASSR